MDGQQQQCNYVSASDHHQHHHHRRRPPGRPRNKWLDQLRNDSASPIGELWRHAIDRGHGGADCHHHHHGRVAGEGCRVVPPPCPWLTARLQSSPIGHVESFCSWSSHLFCGRPGGRRHVQSEGKQGTQIVQDGGKANETNTQSKARLTQNCALNCSFLHWMQQCRCYDEYVSNEITFLMKTGTKCDWLPREFYVKKTIKTCRDSTSKISLKLSFNSLFVALTAWHKTVTNDADQCVYTCSIWLRETANNWTTNWILEIHANLWVNAADYNTVQRTRKKGRNAKIITKLISIYHNSKL